ncbi:uncharacterized protein LOC126378003 [Pectinophora gossypiella]|uniref:uncharacterized protein LOC126378003 n=1 Tax=Pectinophora gossypiella TaxID=13191 RepID=UPI00214E992A|nr:uncharacterized protein LOC126378003 [Pectinophora gossypiella]
MGIINSKGFFSQRQVDEACSNTSLSKLRYVAVEKPKWKVFSKREIRAIPAYNMRGRKGGCPCGSNGPCKLKVTPKGVTMHYPQKNRVVNKVKIVRSKKFPIPTWSQKNQKLKQSTLKKTEMTEDQTSPTENENATESKAKTKTKTKYEKNKPVYDEEIDEDD